MLAALAWCAVACTTPPQPAAVQPSAPAAAAAPSPVPVTTPPAAPAREPEGPPIDIRSTQTQALNYLQSGDADEAEKLLRQIQQADPNHVLARHLLRQIDEDPVVLLGRESFVYRVQPGESLSSIAGRFLKDPFLFYALARYNDIKVPSRVAGGQMIRVPGRQPPSSAATATSSAPSPPSSSSPSPSLQAAPAAASAAAPPPAVSPPVDSRARHIGEYVRAARTCAAKQDLCCAISSWNKVLDIDPNHASARLEKQRATDLLERLRKRGGKVEC